MHLSRQTELIVIALLIAYLSFVPHLQPVREALSTPIGKAVALAGIVYVYECISCPIGLLLVIAYVRCASSSMMEGIDATLAPLSPLTPPTCTPPMKWDETLMMCTSPPVNVNAVSSTPSTAAPAMQQVAGPISSAPITVPGAGMPTMTAVTQPNVGGVQGVVGSGTSSVPAGVL
jgi:hypothetical protein